VPMVLLFMGSSLKGGINEDIKTVKP